MVAPVLITMIQVMVLLLVGLWISIGTILVYRKMRLRHLQLIENTFAETVSGYLYPLPEEMPSLILMQRTFRKLGIKKANSPNVQYLQDLMIRTQSSLLGKNYAKLETLYKQIPPYRASLTKLNSKKWYIKARGIREIYEMDQRQYLQDIIKERNHQNLFVRREAQIALVVFLGWESLRFLPYLQKDVPLWQQIKIVEKLHDLYPNPDVKRLRETYGSEKGYAHELIMRIIRKFDLISEIDYIIHFLDDENFDTRESAIYCISSFTPGEEHFDQIKEKFFKIPNTEQKIQLLRYIKEVTTTVDLPFYKNLLYRGNDIIKLSAAEILWNKGYIEEVQEFYYQQYTNTPEKEVSILHDS